MEKKAKLITGEIVSYELAVSTFEGAQGEIPASIAAVTNQYQYVGVGEYINPVVGEDFMSESPIHFWVKKQNYHISDIKKGDKVLVSLSVGETKTPTWLVMMGTMGNSGMANMITTEGNSVNMPITDSDILYVEEGSTGLPIIKMAMARDAISIGGFHMKAYVDSFGEVPLKSGDYIDPLPGYEKENNSLNIRNSHKILNSGDLIFDQWIAGEDFVIVKSVGTGKSALLAINSISVKRIV